MNCFLCQHCEQDRAMEWRCHYKSERGRIIDDEILDNEPAAPGWCPQKAGE